MRRSWQIGLAALLLAGGIYYFTRPNPATEAAREHLGGDIEMCRLNVPLPLPVTAYFGFHADAVSQVQEMPATVGTPDGKTMPIILKGISGHYPLYGRLGVSKRLKGRIFFTGHRHHGMFGAAVEDSAFKKLGLKLGDIITVDNLKMKIQAVITDEPDHAADNEPRILVSVIGFNRAHHVRDMVAYRYRLRIHDDVAAWRRDFMKQFPDANWSIRDWRDGSPASSCPLPQ